MNWYIYDFFDPALPPDKWLSNNTAGVPSYIKKIAVDLPKQFNRLAGLNGVRFNDWGSDEFIGGIKTSIGSVCVFRVYNGGRDRFDRPGRWILLVAEESLSNWQSINVLEILESGPFREYAKAPVPLPAKLPSLANGSILKVYHGVNSESNDGGTSFTETFHKIVGYSRSMTSCFPRKEAVLYFHKKSNGVFSELYEESSLPPANSKLIGLQSRKPGDFVSKPINNLSSISMSSTIKNRKILTNFIFLILNSLILIFSISFFIHTRLSQEGEPDSSLILNRDVVEFEIHQKIFGISREPRVEGLPTGVEANIEKVNGSRLRIRLFFLRNHSGCCTPPQIAIDND